MKIWSDFIDNLYIKWPEFKKYFFKIFLDLHVKIYVGILIVLNFLTWMAARYIHGEIGSQQIALHYSVDSGIDFYGDIDKIYIIPLLGFFIILINFLLYFNIIIYKDRKFISYILFTTSLVCNLILLISIVSVYLINFR
ncbi:hypothetical protein A2331_05050 [Candidatus Falkowbacteria bacterium RIFOXYB2_FULL_34_18]|uniref:DUF1648 domain-containing protein n=1 Tax=Candidatus Falkowbacteria bacterium RIFOXYD2_FULL_34_120 TaxID=1798007 RepID=A0A1F5TN31_9BACT|nr:MAG: hypothetical protein A2500_07200 [Candidatus Falkowbacteria bacterium RIFOXYC12_FULL_34_55]OGF28714.1 MAG: hypothetical protein A2331_05050 [Candidatus Falkowbacteria bacterium RIFOXYB2_FULL_34_18]OGF38079.1 MAG: hypothetical protein A2466_04230 [Candidatus Falkowbacteria bacterium RIFOXYC2_FULL_34_220]OGF38333.1 MAG: hypothetical protein A2515_06260 [Candidatus Falkowbacteria bacterium RIFOXYD12_FULL_34_57]OGF40320.1 MAG: hypothetical protein A2531_00520 [Candidatus Falkowbacteria bact